MFGLKGFLKWVWIMKIKFVIMVSRQVTVVQKQKKQLHCKSQDQAPARPDIPQSFCVKLTDPKVQGWCLLEWVINP